MSKPRVLVVEDDQWFADSLAKSIAKEKGVSVRTVSDPELGFDIIDDWEPQVMVADLHLGSKNFLTLLNELQSYRDTRMMTKIILSASGHSLGESEMREYGIARVFDKATYQLTDLLNSIGETSCQLI